MAQSQRLAKHVRRQSTEDSIDESDPEESGSDDWEPRGSGTIRVGKDTVPISSPATMSGRTRRTAAAPAHNLSSSSVTVSRSNTPEERRRSIKLTVKLPSSKLREVVTERDVKGVKAFNTEGKYWANKPESHLRRRTQKNYKIPEPSDEEEEEEEEDDDGDAEDEVDEPMNDFEEVSAEAEGSEEEDADGDTEEDIDMDEPTLPPPPKIKLRHTATSDGKPPKPTLIVTPAETGPVKSVEQKEADVDPGDDEEADEDDEEEDLSELHSDDEEQPDETNLDDDGDGEEEDINGGDDLDDDEGDIDLDSEGTTPGSGAATPDLAKMTKRQRREDEGFMALDMAPQIKKHFTQEEQNMRRSEMARRRKNLSEKKVMEEKESTINKLLKKQTSKRRGANAKPETLAAAVAAAEGAENESPGEETAEKANPLYTRWISDIQGVRLGVPEEWLGKHVGRVFGPPHPMMGSKMVEEIE